MPGWRASARLCGGEDPRTGAAALRCGKRKGCDGLVRWIPLIGAQYLGFWALGLVFYALQETPYLLMPLIPLRENPLMEMQESSRVWNGFEKLLGSLCVALMTFVVHRDAVLFSIEGQREALFFAAAIAALLLNLIGWAVYFAGRQTKFVMLFFLAAMPPLYYVCIGLWRNNLPLAAVGCCFLLVHLLHVRGNLRAHRPE